jgi:uncharacterized protein (TIGR03435 family)
MVAVVRAVVALALAGGLLRRNLTDAGIRRRVGQAEPVGGTESASFVQPGGRYTATNVTLRMLVKTAYSLHDDQIIGGPSWIDADRFDIAAKAESAATPSAFRDQARLMLRPLRAERSSSR